MDIDLNLSYLLLLSLSVSIITHILILERKDNHFGPFQNKNRLVEFPPDEDYITIHQQPVTLFDWIRRLFGVYNVENGIWYVDPILSQRWTCPVCLSFWVTLVMVGIGEFSIKPSRNPFIELIIFFSVYAVSAIVNVNLL